MNVYKIYDFDQIEINCYLYTNREMKCYSYIRDKKCYNNTKQKVFCSINDSLYFIFKKNAGIICFCSINDYIEK